MFSAFVVWAKKEIKEFLSTFKSQVFVNKTPFAVVSDCVQEARRCCDQVCHFLIYIHLYY